MVGLGRGTRNESGKGGSDAGLSLVLHKLAQCSVSPHSASIPMESLVCNRKVGELQQRLWEGTAMDAGRDN